MQFLKPLNFDNGLFICDKKKLRAINFAQTKMVWLLLLLIAGFYKVRQVAFCDNKSFLRQINVFKKGSYKSVDFVKKCAWLRLIILPQIVSIYIFKCCRLIIWIIWIMIMAFLFAIKKITCNQFCPNKNGRTTTTFSCWFLQSSPSCILW